MEMTYKSLAHRAGCIRKKYKLTPVEAAWCALWLAGAKETAIPALAQAMAALKSQKVGERHSANS